MFESIYSNVILAVILVLACAFIIAKYGYANQGFSITNLILTYLLVVLMIDIIDMLRSMSSQLSSDRLKVTQESTSNHGLAPIHGTDAMSKAAEAETLIDLADFEDQDDVYVEIKSQTLEGKIDLSSGSIRDLYLTRFLNSKNKAPQLLGSSAQNIRLRLDLYNPVSRKFELLDSKQNWSVVTPDKSSGQQAILSTNNPVTIQTSIANVGIVRRTFVLADDYLIKISDSLLNDQTQATQVLAYAELIRPEEGLDKENLTDLDDIVVWSESLKFIDNDTVEAENQVFKTENRWMVFSDDNWLVGMLFNKESKTSNMSALYKRNSKTYNLNYVTREIVMLQPDQEMRLQTWQLLVAPKIDALLLHYEGVAQATDLNKTKDWGWFSMVNFPLFVALEKINQLVNNYGWSILILTILIRILLMPLTFKAQKSSRMLQEIKPKIDKIRELYKDQPEQIEVKILGLYRENKINPFTSLLFILPQIPIMYSIWRLTRDIALNNQPFILWMQNLSGIDSFMLINIQFLGIFVNLLGLLTSVTLYFGVFDNLNKSLSMGIQAKIILLAVFSWLFSYLTVGLSLYLICSNLITPLQNWIINYALDKNRK